MREFSPRSKTLAAGAAGALALTLMSAGTAAAQSRDYYGGPDPVLGAILRAAAGAVINGGVNGYGYGDSRYGYDQGAYRGADCQYYRGGRCYRNQGHWERENGINSRDYGGYGAYGEAYGRYGADDRYQDGRYYEGRGYYRDGRWYRNYGQWRSRQNHRNDGREYRYDRRW